MSDYIKRQDLLDLYAADGLPERDGGYVVPIEVVRQNILDQPAADVRPVVKGEWEPIADYDVFRCSHCGKCFDTPYLFCPNCGSDMRGNDK